jgi:glutathione S-transferase
MYVLYGRMASGSAVVEAMLELAGAPYRFEAVPRGEDSRAPPGYLAVNPMGQVPALVLPDGTMMAESAAITIYLADRHPELGLAPPADSPKRATYLRWMLFLAASVYQSNMRTYYSERYTDDPDGAALVKSEAMARTAREWEVYGAALGKGPFILGEEMSAADLYACMLASWNFDPPAFFERHPNIKAMYGRVAANLVIAKVWARNEM